MVTGTHLKKKTNTILKFHKIINKMYSVVITKGIPIRNIALIFKYLVSILINVHSKVYKY